jgi:hypothetical protein
MILYSSRNVYRAMNATAKLWPKVERAFYKFCDEDDADERDRIHSRVRRCKKKKRGSMVHIRYRHCCHPRSGETSGEVSVVQ